MSLYARSYKAKNIGARMFNTCSALSTFFCICTCCLHLAPLLVLPGGKCHRTAVEVVRFLCVSSRVVRITRFLLFIYPPSNDLWIVHEHTCLRWNDIRLGELRTNVFSWTDIDILTKRSGGTLGQLKCEFVMCLRFSIDLSLGWFQTVRKNASYAVRRNVRVGGRSNSHNFQEFLEISNLCHFSHVCSC